MEDLYSEGCLCFTHFWVLLIDMAMFFGAKYSTTIFSFQSLNYNLHVFDDLSNVYFCLIEKALTQLVSRPVRMYAHGKSSGKVIKLLDIARPCDHFVTVWEESLNP